MTSESPKEIFWNGMDYASTMPFAGGLSYTLTANAQAMVAAAYEDATEVVAHDHVCDAIRARTTADSQAALDALLQAERVKALKEAMQIAEQCDSLRTKMAIKAVMEKKHD